MKTPRLVAVPLDDRPVNHQALAQLAGVAGVRVSLPPRRLLGRFRKPGDCERLREWLESQLPGADGAVLSLDMLCYGGLVASRAGDVSQDEAIGRLYAVKRSLYRARVPAVASSVLLRQSTTVSDAASLARWKRLFELMGLPDSKRAAALAAETDPSMTAEIRNHLACRARNHAVNRHALELCATGIFDYVAILKEDCSPEGVHRLEEAELLALRARIGIESRSALEPGADEGGMLLLARMALRAFRLTPAVSLTFTPDHLSSVVPLYEDRALARTVAAQVPVAGLVQRDGADLALSIVSASPTGRDLFASAPDTHPRSDVRTWPPPLEITARLLRGNAARWPVEMVVVPPGKAAPRTRALRGVAAAIAYGTHPSGDRPGPAGHWAVADVGLANGADPALARELLDAGLARWVSAYAGWNTAANTCGAALAHLAALACPGLSSARRAAQVRYLLTRWIDDYIYQGVVRREVLDRCAAGGLNPYALGPAGREIQAFLGPRMAAATEELLGRLLSSPLLAPGGPVKLARRPRVTCKLPWNRAFECEVRLEGLDVREI